MISPHLPTDESESAAHEVYEQCVANGLPRAWQRPLKALLVEYKSCFTNKVGRTPAAQVTPCVTHQRVGTAPYFGKVRRSSDQDSNLWRREIIDVPNYSSRWASLLWLRAILALVTVL